MDQVSLRIASAQALAALGLTFGSVEEAKGAVDDFAAHLVSNFNPGPQIAVASPGAVVPFPGGAA